MNEKGKKHTQEKASRCVLLVSSLPPSSLHRVVIIICQFLCVRSKFFFSHKFLLFTSQQKRVREMQVDSGKTVHLGAHRIQYFKKVLCFCEAKSGKEAKKRRKPE